jgi:hypothetical protein
MKGGCVGQAVNVVILQKLASLPVILGAPSFVTETILESMTLDQQMHSYYTFLYFQYNRCESVRHVSIPCWDHHQGLF